MLATDQPCVSYRPESEITLGYALGLDCNVPSQAVFTHLPFTVPEGLGVLLI